MRSWFPGFAAIAIVAALTGAAFAGPRGLSHGCSMQAASCYQRCNQLPNGRPECRTECRKQKASCNGR